MTPCWVCASRSALVLAASAAVLIGCGSDDVSASASSPSGDESDAESATASGPSSSSSAEAETTAADTEAPIGWFEVGWGQDEFIPIADGDDFPIVLGGQGAQMFPMPLRGAEFYLPGNPTTWMDETGPFVDFEMDIEGYNDGPGGHFKRIANYTLDWVVLDDGTYLSSFLAILVPDGIDAETLDGLPAHLWVRVRPHEQPALELELDVIVTVDTESLPG
jgi:hypothetical protein